MAAGEKSPKEPGVDDYDPGQEQERPWTFNDFDIPQDSGNTEGDNPRIETHTNAAKRFRTHTLNDESSDRNSYQHTRQDLRDQL
jgi:hypothetical protein